ncbi:MAG: G1 family glutamic endopeptidase [Parachlamydiaceae bacterium]|nr:G1 family glutamic endopeptidase [Parachlamydiaceae bacterium]
MRKLLTSAVFYIIFFSNLAADITVNLQGYKNIECEFEERVSYHKKPTNGSTFPHVPINIGTSTNWCGYVSATNIFNPTPKSVTAVIGTWVVPKLKPTLVNSYTAIWVGIDGFNNNTVEQIGTEHDWINGQQVHSAWFEMYPEPSYNIIGFPVNVNDIIQGQVLYLGKTQFQLNLVNHTRKIYTTIPHNRTKSAVAIRSSAEWIVEAPFNNGILPLSNFERIVFVNCAVTINQITGAILRKGWEIDALAMNTTEGIIKALPSPLTPNKQAFVVTWNHE